MIKVWDIRPVLESRILRGHTRSVGKVAFSPRGHRIVTASDDHTARIWDAESGKALVVLSGEQGEIAHASFSPDGLKVLTSADVAQIWDAEAGKMLLPLIGHTDAVEYGMYSRDGAQIVTASTDKTARVWDATTGVSKMTLVGHSDRVFYADFSRDGTRVVTASRDETVRIWDLSSGKELLSLPGHNGSLSPDGNWIVTAPGSDAAVVWDAKTGKRVLDLRGHQANVWSAFFSPDSKRIVTASWDKTAKVWDSRTGTELFTLRGHTDSLWDARFSPDGLQIATAGGDGVARLWDAAPWTRAAWQDPESREQLISLAMRHAPHSDVTVLDPLTDELDEVTTALKSFSDMMIEGSDAANSMSIGNSDSGLFLIDEDGAIEESLKILKPGEVVLRADGKPIRTPVELGLVIRDFLESVLRQPSRVNRISLETVSQFEYMNRVLHIRALELREVRKDPYELLLLLKEAAAILERYISSVREETIQPNVAPEVGEIGTHLGLEVDDRVVAVNDVPIARADELLRSVNEYRENLSNGSTKSFSLLVERLRQDKRIRVEIIVSP